MENTDISKRERFLHYTMAFVGGIFAIYAILEYSNIFASAETVNMISLVNDLFSGSFPDALARFGNVIIYAVGIITAAWFSRYRPTFSKSLSIAIDFAAAVILCFIPTGAYPTVALYPAVFAMAVQFSTFRGIAKNPSSTTFSTANFRQLVTNLFNYLADRKSEDFSNFKFYAFTMLSFHLGIISLHILRPYLGHLGILISFIPLTFAAIQERAIRKIKCLSKNFR